MEIPKNLLNSAKDNNQPRLNNGKDSHNNNYPWGKNRDSRNENNGSGGGKKLAFTLAFVGGAILGLLVGWLFMGKDVKHEDLSSEKMVDEAMLSGDASSTLEDSGDISKSANAGGAKTISAAKEAVAVDGSNAIQVNDQLAGTNVEAEMVTISVPGWVVIREDKDGELGNILGVSRFDPGIHLGEIELLRGTVSGGKYHAVLYQDNGDKVFNINDDAPIKDAEGNLIESIFVAE